MFIEVKRMSIAAFIEKNVDIPADTTVSLEKGVLKVKGPKGALEREFIDPAVSLSIRDNAVLVRAEFPNMREKVMIGTWNSHVKNMMKGVTKGYTYTMKLVYSHFPVKVTVKDDRVVIENFMGEKSPRYAKILEGTKVNVKGDQVVLEGINKEAVGQTMANIEKATKVKGFDNRVFQDGIYLTDKE